MTQPTDLIFFRSDSWLGRAIRWFTRRKNEPGTFTNHVGGFIDEYIILEALVTVKQNFFDLYDPHHDKFEIWRNTKLTPEQIESIRNKAMDYESRKYGFFKLLTHALDALLNKITRKEIFFFRKLNNVDRYPICSWLWAYAYNRGLNYYEFGVDPKYATPDDMHDYVSESSDWELVYKN
jgi:hypothetical protein